MTAQAAQEWPHNADCEEQVIGSMLLDDRTVGVCLGMLSEDDFHIVPHATIFRHMKALAVQGKPISAGVVANSLANANELEGIGGYMFILTIVERNCYTTGAAENAEIVREKAAHRRIMRAAHSIAKLAQSCAMPPDELAAKAHEMFFAATANTALTKAEPVRSTVQVALSHLAEAMEARLNGAPMGVQFGLGAIDGLTGGLQAGELTVLAARPSVGKTILAMEAVRHNAKRGNAALVFSLEMSTEELHKRWFSAESGVPYTAVQNARMDQHQFASIGSRASNMMDWPVEIDESSGLSADEIYIRTRMAKARNPKLKLVVIDSLGLMNHGEGRKTGQNRAQLMGISVNTLRRMAKDQTLGVAVLLIHHLSRADSSQRPTLQDLRDSGEIEQWVHNALFLHPDGERVNGYAPTLMIAGKQRHRGTGECSIVMDGSHQRFIPEMFQ